MTRNAFGKGTLTYEGTVVSDALQEKILANALKSAGIDLSDSALPPGIKVKHAWTPDGRPVHFIYNFSAEPKTFAYRYENGTDLLSGKSVIKNQNLALAPWDVAIVR